MNIVPVISLVFVHFYLGVCALNNKKDVRELKKRGSTTVLKTD
jgi:hypothetical protein